MIYYFSATGNSEWVARELARGTGDQAASMTEWTRSKSAPEPVRRGETLGLVFPVYAWSPPRLVIDFVRRLTVESGAFVYGVCTMGEMAGDVFRILRRSIRVDSCYSIKMPSNYIVMSGREPDRRIEAKIAAARRRIPEICAAVRAHRVEFEVRRGPGALLFSACASRLFNRFATDRKFHAEANCTGCGLCAKLCPLGNITLESGRPVWHGDCMHCMACIQHCPVEAINYGGRTAGRARYVFGREQ